MWQSHHVKCDDAAPGSEAFLQESMHMKHAHEEQGIIPNRNGDQYTQQ